jgi:hypothetical protein
MKLQLDTTAKTVKIESDIKVSLLIKTLKSLLPNDWRDFTLQTHTTITRWTSPTIIREYPAWPHYPWYCNTNTTDIVDSSGKYNCELKSGIYNVEI